MTYFTDLGMAIASAQKWHGRCSVVARRTSMGDYGYVIEGGAWSTALYVTIGMKYADWERTALGTENALLQIVVELYSAIGHDVCSGEDGCVEDDEVASVLLDRMYDYVEEEHGTDLARAWRNLPYSKKWAICKRAL